MSIRSEDLCPLPAKQPALPTAPHAPPIFPASVYECRDPAQADELLGSGGGYVYLRDGHPNADMLAAKCAALHAAERATITASGMAALAAAVLSQLQAGDHVIVSQHLYGRSLTLLADEASRWGLTHTLADTCDLAAARAAMQPTTRMVVVETITNPVLRVSDVAALAALCHEQGALLLVDNTLASPALCRPLEWGADLVLESLTKIMNGHSDVVLGMLCGRAELWQRVPGVVSTWGLASSPFDCWLALRGISTLSLRADRAAATALTVARFLQKHPGVSQVCYPGLPDHPDHDLAQRQFGHRYGAMVTFTLVGGRPAADRFIPAAAARGISFCPSLGEPTTTLSHPQSTSHRALPEAQRQSLGITGGTIRLSVGIESPDHIQDALATSLAATTA